MKNIIMNNYFSSILEEYSSNYDSILNIDNLNLDILVDPKKMVTNNIFYNKLLLSDIDFMTKNDFINKKYINKQNLDYYPGQNTQNNIILIDNNNNFKTTIADDNQYNCCICLETINKNEQVYNLDCGRLEQLHIFHKLCFEKWNKNSCPYCRTIITVK
jgi:hypothetical protein